MKKTFAERCEMMEQSLPGSPFTEMVKALHSEMLGELEALRAENERLKYREKNCATENQAMLVGAVRFMQEATEAVGKTMADSPAQVLERLKELSGGILREREACARAAEGFKDDDDCRHWVPDSLYDTLRRETAAAIRRRSQPSRIA
jgi:uncharacterized membrane-anchored protein